MNSIIKLILEVNFRIHSWRVVSTCDREKGANKRTQRLKPQVVLKPQPHVATSHGWASRAEVVSAFVMLSRIETVSDTVTMVDPLRSRKPDCLYLDVGSCVSEKHRVRLGGYTFER